MLHKTIKFKASEFFVLEKEINPIASFKELPEWFKSLKETTPKSSNTLRMCKPFFDSLTAGYVIKATKDIDIKTFVNEKGEEDYADHQNNFNSNYVEQKYGKRTNLNTNQWHAATQLGEKCPFHSHNNNRNYYKYLNCWYIYTPPGYSCLFTPILNITSIINTLIK